VYHLLLTLRSINFPQTVLNQSAVVSTQEALNRLRAICTKDLLSSSLKSFVLEREILHRLGKSTLAGDELKSTFVRLLDICDIRSYDISLCSVLFHVVFLNLSYLREVDVRPCRSVCSML